MSADPLKTLMHPFEADVLPAPAAGETVLFLGARPELSLPPDFGASLLLVQGFRPYYRALSRAGFAVRPEPEGGGYDTTLLLCGRHRGWNELMIAEALERTRPEGLIVVAGAKDDGIAALRKRIAAILPVADSLPKHHGIAFWLARPAEAADAIAALRAANPPIDLGGGLVTSPGMFSHGAVDLGSQLLAAKMPTTLSGNIADFCAGWGYLAAYVAATCPKVQSIDLYEADHASLETARSNLTARPGIAWGFHWHDLAAEPVERRYDTVVMNPPFHQQRAADPGIGQALIRAAAAALRPGGALYLVANRNLPYEGALQAAFRTFEQIADQSGFKVIRAVR